MTNTTYSVTNEHGDASGQGRTQDAARKAAQHEANRVGATRYVVSESEDDASKDAEAFEPEITKSDIKALMSEASEHGDEAQHALCDAALNGDAAARAECARVIRENRARSGE